MAEVIELEYDAFGRANYYYCNKIVPAGRYVRESDYLALMHDKLAIEGRVNQLVDNYNVLQLKDQNNEAAIAAYIATIEKLQAQRDELLEALHEISTRYFPSDNAIELMRALARTAIRRVEGK